MNHRSIHAVVLFATAAFFVPTCAPAQWINYPDPATPRTRDGKPNLSAKAPRTSDGKPDLSGIWQPEAAPKEMLVRYFKDGVNGLGEDDPTIYFLNMLADYPFENAPMTPAAAAIFRARGERRGQDSPANHCAPWGLPIVDTEPSPSKIV
jgi:hypothetical protein